MKKSPDFQAALNSISRQIYLPDSAYAFYKQNFLLFFQDFDFQIEHNFHENKFSAAYGRLPK